MSVELEQEAMEVAQWFAHHRDTITDVEKKLEFLVKFSDHALWLLARAIQDIKNLEHRAKVENNMRPLLLPKGIKLHDGLRARN